MTAATTIRSGRKHKAPRLPPREMPSQPSQFWAEPSPGIPDPAQHQGPIAVTSHALTGTVATARDPAKPCAGQTLDPPGPTGSLAGSSARAAGHPNPGASGSVNRLLRPESVRHMSVTTATQRHTMKHSGTTTRRPPRPGKPSSRAIFAGGGRCWVRTNVG